MQNELQLLIKKYSRYLKQDKSLFSCLLLVQKYTKKLAVISRQILFNCNNFSEFNQEMFKNEPFLITQAMFEAFNKTINNIESLLWQRYTSVREFIEEKQNRKKLWNEKIHTVIDIVKTAKRFLINLIILNKQNLAKITKIIFAD